MSFDVSKYKQPIILQDSLEFPSCSAAKGQIFRSPFKLR